MTVVHVKSPAIEAADKKALEEPRCRAGECVNGPLAGQHKVHHAPTFRFVGPYDKEHHYYPTVVYAWDEDKGWWYVQS